MHDAQLLSRWAGLRVLGGGLFFMAVGLFSLGLFTIFSGQLPLGRVMPCMLTMGLSLASFGTADDTLLATLKALRRQGPLAPNWAEEWQKEAIRRPRRLKEVHASPRAAMVIPLLAILAQGWVGRMLILAWGIL